MRPWFTLTIIAVIAGCLLSFWLIVDFVLLNRVMFETPLNIIVRVPFSSWSHAWTEVPFMYLLTISVLLGAGIVALTTLIFDTKRALKVRRMRKELGRLQKALEEAQAKLPPPPDPEAAKNKDSSIEDPESNGTLSSGVELPDNEKSGTPEEIAHSFENIVEQGDDFLNVAQKRVEDELERHGGRRPEGDIRAIVTGFHEGSSAQNGDGVTSEKNTESADEEPDTISDEQEEMPAQHMITAPDDVAEETVTEDRTPDNDDVRQHEAAQEQPAEVRDGEKEENISAMEAELVDDDAGPGEENADGVMAEDDVSVKKIPSDS